MTELRDILASVIVPLRSLWVAAAGAFAASLWFKNTREAATVLIVVIVGGYVFDLLGRGALPDYPRAAIYLMEAWAIVPVAVGIAAAAAIVVLTVNLAAPSNASEGAKEVAKAYTAALTAFATAAVIAREIDKAESPIARRIRD